MNWKECVNLLELYDLGDRFTWPPDALGFDCDVENFTISDVWGAISWIWTWPGDWVLSQEPIKTFFEIEGATATGAIGSTLIGFFLLYSLTGILSVWLE